MKEAGREILEKGMESRSGLMEPDMKETGAIIKQMAKGSLFMLMEISIKAIG